MNFRDTRSRRREDPSLDMTPLIDVVFLLLIFFLITTTFVRNDNRQLPLNLPSAAAGQEVVEGEKLILYITEDGGLQINDEIVRPEEVPERLEALYKENPDTPLSLKADRATRYEQVTRILGTARKVGFQKLNLVVKPEKP